MIDSENKIPQLQITGTEKLATLKHLIDEIPNRYANQIHAIFEYLSAHTTEVTLEDQPTQNNPEHV